MADMKLMSALPMLLVFVTGAACAVAPSEPEPVVIEDAQPQLAADQHIDAELAAMSDDVFFDYVKYQPIDESRAGAMPWARSSYLATVDMVDGIRFATNHRARMSLFLLGDRFVADYQELEWSSAGWVVSVERDVSGRVNSGGSGRIDLSGFGIARRTIVRGQAAVVVELTRDVASRGAQGQTFVARRVLSSAAFTEK
jgi:hypothetical protein